MCHRHYQRAKYHGLVPPRRAPVRDCQHCGRTFTGVRRNVRFCSAECINAAKYLRRAPERLRVTCEACGSALVGKTRKARFCADQCRDAYQNAKRSAERWEQVRASRKPCLGCGGAIPETFTSRARYCSRECRIRARRHETYGLTHDELATLLDQHDVCAICETADWGKKGPQVDHCHATGRVRGILCTSCNNGLGRFGDDPKRLRKAAEYLER